MVNCFTCRRPLLIRKEKSLNEVLIFESCESCLYQWKILWRFGGEPRRWRVMEISENQIGEISKTVSFEKKESAESEEIA